MMPEERARIALAVKAAIGETPGPARVRCSIVFKDWVTSNSERLVCGLNYPVGTRITEIDFTYRVGVGGSVGIGLERQALTGAMATTTVASALDTTDVAPSETTVLVCNHTMQAGFRYRMVFAIGTAGATAFGAVVKRDRL